MQGRWLLFATAVGIAAGPAGAEKMKLANGDVLDGEVVDRDADGVVLEHPVLGRLEIPASQLSISTTREGMFGTTLLRGWDRRLELAPTAARATRT